MKKNLKLLNLPLENIKIVNSYEVHEIGVDWEKEKFSNPLKLVKSNVLEHTAIIGIVDKDKVKHSIYCAVKDKGDGEFFSVEQVAGVVEVILKAGGPSEKNKVTSPGLYWGDVCRVNYEPGEDDLLFTLSIPKEQLSSLISAVRLAENATVEVSAYLLSFTSEVDDFFGEYYYSRDIIINDDDLEVPCFISQVCAVSKVRSCLKSKLNGDYRVDSCEKEKIPYWKSLSGLVTAL